MIDILTGTAFDAPRRMHHGVDEVAAEFPSSVSSRRRGLLALKAQNWRAGGSPTPHVPTARDYVQNGLIHMWDGIENVGWGTHDESSTTWVDIVGGVELVRDTGYTYWIANALHVSGKASAAISRTDCSGQTVEVVFKSGKSGSAQSVFSFSTSNSPGQWVAIRANNTVNCRNGGPFFSPTSIVAPMSVSSIGDRIFNDGSDVTTTSGGLTFGTIYGSGASFSTYPFTGDIFCARSYSRILTDAEIAANYAVDKARFGLP